MKGHGRDLTRPRPPEVAIIQRKWDPLFQISKRLMNYHDLARRVEYNSHWDILWYLLKSGEIYQLTAGFVAKEFWTLDIWAGKDFFHQEQNIPWLYYCLYETPDQVSEFPSPVVYPPRHETWDHNLSQSSSPSGATSNVLYNHPHISTIAFITIYHLIYVYNLCTIIRITSITINRHIVNTFRNDLLLVFVRSISAWDFWGTCRRHIWRILVW